MVVVSYLERLVEIFTRFYGVSLCFVVQSRAKLKSDIIISNMFYLGVFIFTRRISVWFIIAVSWGKNTLGLK
jgi:hypothetical protein